MADRDVEENLSDQLKKRNSKKDTSRVTNSRNNLGLQEDEDKHVPHLVEVSNSKTITSKKRKIDACTGTSSLIDDNKIAEIFKDVGSGKLKKVKRDKYKGKACGNLNDCKTTTNKYTFQAKCVEDSNPNSYCVDNFTSTTDKEPLHPAISYLVAWKKSKSTWSFKKSRQVWLLKNMYDVTKISNKHFKILTKYLKDIKGKSREETLALARKITEKAIEGDVIESEKELQRNRAEKVIELLV